LNNNFLIVKNRFYFHSNKKNLRIFDGVSASSFLGKVKQGKGSQNIAPDERKLYSAIEIPGLLPSRQGANIL